MNHFHVAPYKGTKRNPNSMCRCSEHGTGLRGQALPTNKPEPSCAFECYMCQRIRQLPAELKARFGD